MAADVTLETFKTSLRADPIRLNDHGDGQARKICNGNNDGARRFGDAGFAQVMLGIDPDPANDHWIIGGARHFAQALHPHSVCGEYVHIMMGEWQDLVKPAYRDNYQGLVAVWSQYDPATLVRVNQNIRPSK
jgi:hypothetical protein